MTWRTGTVDVGWLPLPSGLAAASVLLRPGRPTVRAAVLVSSFGMESLAGERVMDAMAARLVSRASPCCG